MTRGPVSAEPRPDLALDPACWRTGYGVLRPDGSLREERADEQAERERKEATDA